MLDENRKNQLRVRSINQTFDLNPKTSLDLAQRIADDVIDMETRLAEAEASVIILIREFLKINDDGYFPSEVQEKIDANPRLQKAIKKALRLHAHIACGPFGGGFKAFDRRIDRDFKDISS